MKISKIAKKMSIALATAGVVMSATNALDADLAACRSLARVKTLAQQARDNGAAALAHAKTAEETQILGRMDDDLKAFLKQDSNAVINQRKAQYETAITTYLDGYVAGGNGAALFRAGTLVNGVPGAGPNAPTDLTLGEFKTALHTVITNSAPAAVNFAGIAGPKYNLYNLGTLIGPVDVTLQADITAFMDALANAGNDDILDAGLATGNPGEPADHERDSFRDTLLNLV